MWGNKMKTKHIPRYLMWSGGADSTYMMLRLHQEGIRVDKVFFSNTGMEFPEMYEYVKKVEEYMKRKYNVTVIHLTTSDGHDYFSFSRGVGKIRGVYQVRGIPRQLEPCWLQREAKVKPFELWLKENKTEQHLLYIGYTSDELRRARMQTKKMNDKKLQEILKLPQNEKETTLLKELETAYKHEDKLIANHHLYPLVLWDIDSDDVKVELQKMGMLNPLYKYFDRTGCFMCPKVGKDYYFKMWKHYPSEWSWMKKEEKKLRKLKAFNSQFNKDQSLKEMEKEFEDGSYEATNYLRDTKEDDFCMCII